MKDLVIYHGSPDIVEVPEFGKGSLFNDYGQGFYCTEQVELAKEWACLEGQDGYANKYLIDTDSVNILNLGAPEFSILHWLTILTEHRKLRISTTAMKRGMEWLQQNFHVDLEPYDVIIGYRADDSYFSFARAFLTNQISVAQLSYAMKLGKLGEQFVLMTPKAFEQIRYVSHEVVDSTEYYVKRKARDEEARAAYLAMLEEADEDGIYLRDITRVEVKPNDIRLW